MGKLNENGADSVCLMIGWGGGRMGEGGWGVVIPTGGNWKKITGTFSDLDLISLKGTVSRDWEGLHLWFHWRYIQ